MTYQQTIDYLYSRLPMFSKQGARAYKKDLHNTIVLLDALGNPHHEFKSIHIAGTNGKGSTSHMLASAFHHSGYRTGLYTSPHLYDFRERIRVSNGPRLDMVPEDFVIAFTGQIQPLIESIEPSFFEVTVAMAFKWFATCRVDMAIIETGLGGRLDSTNVITPELGIITNIGWDHMNILGDTLEKIASEKAGIIKPGVTAVIGECLPETEPVFRQKAAECASELHKAEDRYELVSLNPGMERLEAVYRSKTDGSTWHAATDLSGIYQQYNLRTVRTAIDLLRLAGWKLPEACVEKALLSVIPTTGLFGRWQVIRRRPWLVLDVAHNEDGMKQLSRQVEAMREQGAFNRLWLVTGMVRDKDVAKTLLQLPASDGIAYTAAHLPRAMPAAELAYMGVAAGREGPAFENVNEAVDHMLAISGPNDLLLVCGSIFLVAEVDIARYA